MTPQQQALIQKAPRGIQSAIGQNETGFPVLPPVLITRCFTAFLELLPEVPLRVAIAWLYKELVSRSRL